MFYVFPRKSNASIDSHCAYASCYLCLCYLPGTRQGRYCLGFMYNMPTDAATLSVFVMSGGNRTLVWERGARRTAGWQEASVIIDVNQPFQVRSRDAWNRHLRTIASV